MVHSARFLIIIVGIISFIGAICEQGFAVQPLDRGPFHEAYVTRTKGSEILEAIPSAPPAPITERIPPQKDPGAIWIGGYWAWSSQYNDFIWISGVWRVPPPGHQWITGLWKEFDDGWVWIHGFWSEVPQAAITYIDIPPPDQLDENVDGPPSSNYFWMPGFWAFSSETHAYEWSPGHWETIDPNWVFVPSYYLWRPGGYVFVLGYWDWTLERNGSLFAPIFINPAERAQIVYEPNVIVEEVVVVQYLIPYYPDYLCFFQHHHHYHPAFWDSCACSPPWWRWDTWWCYSWQDQWSVWWWYSHPGYPNPHWMTAELSASIAPPSHQVIEMFKHVKAPTIVTSKGVVAPSKILNAVFEVSGKEKSQRKIPPIISSNQKVSAQIQQLVQAKQVPVKATFKPTGRIPALQLAKNPPLKPITAISTAKNEKIPTENLSPERKQIIHLPKKPFLPEGIKPLKSAQEREKMKPLPPVTINPLVPSSASSTNVTPVTPSSSSTIQTNPIQTPVKQPIIKKILPLQQDDSVNPQKPPKPIIIKRPQGTIQDTPSHPQEIPKKITPIQPQGKFQNIEQKKTIISYPKQEQPSGPVKNIEFQKPVIQRNQTNLPSSISTPSSATKQQMQIQTIPSNQEGRTNVRENLKKQIQEKNQEQQQK